MKNIEEGLVVDLTSLYNNNVTLKVEGNPIATGSLVIVNDRYGVKINEVLAGDNAGTSSSTTGTSQTQTTSLNDEDEEDEEENYSGEDDSEEEDESEDDDEGDENDGDFDYSDFELEDENI